ncbi:DNA topoisomerase III [Pectobacterium atrosepticum ICMP 1526]|uniref:type IA DNA topoisomerase n=1 Tax=Pectobacterium atrosepticum TaxID=29471 RepID=UPI00065DAAC1|nr:type IA DNA topoisomerase [Pectobacterium atrosepticum]KMK87261.1 DNA topoisomerase III [Pectobacterium atrosepticum ICMP 1526]
MRLFIAEKPQVGKDIANALGNAVRKDGYFQCGNDYVTWCVGHIIKSAEPEFYNPDYAQWIKEDLPLRLFPVKYEPKPETAEQVKIVVNLINKADIIIHAGDPDDEGQLLVDEVLIYAENTNPVKRLLINDNTDAAVKKAIGDIKDNNRFKGMFNRALARSVGDNIFGFSMTRAFTIEAKKNGYNGVLSVGRVQTPVLGLICKRWLENTSHKQTTYQTIQAEFLHSDNTFKANWKVSDNAPQDDKKRLNDEAYAKALVQSFKGKEADIVSAAVDKKESAPPLPFNLSDLQQFLNKKYKLSADDTLKLTQALRDKYKCITYNRSDCSYLSEEQYQESPQILEVLKSVFTQPLDIDPSRKSKAFNSENITAHTAIIPTTNVPDLSKLTKDEKVVYLSIAERYLIQFMPLKCYQEASAVMKIGLDTFSARAINVTDKGFTAFYADSEEDDEEQNDAAPSDFDVLKSLRTGETVNCTGASYQNNKTKPKALFTEASLLNAMDNIVDHVTTPHIRELLKAKDKGKKKGQKGIGTQATRASYVPLLIKRGFIKKDGQKIIPTQAGIDFYQSLPKSVTEPDLTALWAEKQNELERGELSVDDFINDLYVEISNLISENTVNTLKVTAQSSRELLTFPCPSCGDGLENKGNFIACVGHCGFRLFWTISQKTLTLKQMESLVVKGETALIKGFVSKKSGKPFDAVLTMTDKITGAVTFKFSQLICPNCGGSVVNNGKRVSCTKNCGFGIWTTISGVSLAAAQIEALLIKGKTGVIKGFVSSKTGKSFDAALKLEDKPSGRLSFEFPAK